MYAIGVAAEVMKRPNVGRNRERACCAAVKSTINYSVHAMITAGIAVLPSVLVVEVIIWEETVRSR